MFIFGRIYARIGLVRHFGVDDYLITIGWFSALALCVLACLGTQYGEGMHEQDIPDEFLKPALKLNWATRLVYQAGLAFTKLSIAVFYLRVFTTTRAKRIEIYVFIAFVTLFTVGLLVASILSCVPPQKAWNVEIPGYCTNTIVAFWVSFVCGMISDIWLIVFAVPKVWSLKLQRSQKIALLSTLTLGWVVVVAGIVRVVRIRMILRDPDITWASYDSSIWSSVETDVALICAAAPALKPIFKRFTPGFLYSLSASRSRSTRQPGNTNQSQSQSLSTWTKASHKGSKAFEMSTRSRGTQHEVGRSHSEEELARSVGHRYDDSWVSGGRSEMAAWGPDEDDEYDDRAYGRQPDGITKQT